MRKNIYKWGNDCFIQFGKIERGIPQPDKCKHGNYCVDCWNEFMKIEKDFANKNYPSLYHLYENFLPKKLPSLTNI